MKKNTSIPILATAGGAVAFALRLAQLRFGFAPETGLPIPGSLPALLLVLVLAGLAAALFLLSRRLRVSEPDPRPFQDAFSVQSAIVPLVAGLALMLLSGAADVRTGLLGFAPDLAIDGEAPSILLPAVIVGGLTALFALCLISPIFVAAGGRRSRKQHGTVPELLLVPQLALVLRLIFTYRTRSVNPALESYYVELLALACAILGFFLLSSFAFDDGDPARFSFWSALSVIFCFATLADGHGLSTSAFYGGCALIQLGFLVSFVPGLSVRRQQSLS